MVEESSPQQTRPAAEIIRSAVCLTAAVVLALPLALWWGFDFAGPMGVWAGLSAAGLCLAASLAALLVRMQFSRPQEVVTGTLGAMLARMGIVFGAGALIASFFPQLVPAAFWGQNVVFFLLTLTVETFLAVQWAKRLEVENTEANSEEQSSLPNHGVKAV